MEGSQILNLGHVTWPRPLLVSICHAMASACHIQCVCQIWSFYI